MFTGYAEAVAREQHKDNLRRIEKANLVRQLERNNNRFDVWKAVGNRLKVLTTRQKTVVRREAKTA